MQAANWPATLVLCCLAGCSTSPPSPSAYRPSEPHLAIIDVSISTTWANVWPAFNVIAAVRETRGIATTVEGIDLTFTGDGVFVFSKHFDGSVMGPVAANSSTTTTQLLAEGGILASTVDPTKRYPTSVRVSVSYRDEPSKQTEFVAREVAVPAYPASCGGLNVSAHPNIIDVGQNAQMGADFVFCQPNHIGVTDLTRWESATPSIATVTRSGLVTGIANGMAVIRGTYGVATASYNIWVGPLEAAPLQLLVQGFTVIRLGVSWPMTAQAFWSGGVSKYVADDASWQSSDSRIATVSRGLVTALAPGDTTISATYRGVAGSHQVTVSR